MIGYYCILYDTQVKMGVILDSTLSSHIMLQALHWLPVKQRIHHQLLRFTIMAIHSLVPPYVADLLHIATSVQTTPSAHRVHGNLFHGSIVDGPVDTWSIFSKMDSQIPLSSMRMSTLEMHYLIRVIACINTCIKHYFSEA